MGGGFGGGGGGGGGWVGGGGGGGVGHALLMLLCVFLKKGMTKGGGHCKRTRCIDRSVVHCSLDSGL